MLVQNYGRTKIRYYHTLLFVRNIFNLLKDLHTYVEVANAL